MSGAGDVVCEGWLRKSPPEKKLRRYAWKRRWFMLRSGRLSGEPDVLQYYKNPQSRRPIGTINLNLCEQVDAGLSFTKKELESSFVFDLKTVERTWYLVTESEEDMNRWVSSICLLCAFNPTDDDRPPVRGPPAVATAMSTAVTAAIATVTASVPPPYDPVSVRHLEPGGHVEEEDYLWLSQCQSHVSPPSGSSTSLDADYNDSVCPPPSATSSSSSSSSSPSLLPNGVPPPSSGCRTAAWTVGPVPGSSLSQALDASVTSDPAVSRPGRPRCHPSPHPRKHSLDLHLRPVAIPLSEDTPPHPVTYGGYQIPRPASAPQPPPARRRPSSTPSVDSLTQSELHAVVPALLPPLPLPPPPPRPPKPAAIAVQGETWTLGAGPATLPRSSSHSERREVGVEGGGALPRSNTVTSVPGRTHTGVESSFVSQSDRVFEFSDSFSSYFLSKGLVPLSSVCPGDDDVEENYVSMNASITEPPVAPRAPPLPPSDSFVHVAYVPMTPATSAAVAGDSASLGSQVPPPVHMGFRTSSPLTPAAPASPMLRRSTCVNTSTGVEATPPPVHRNLKPQRKVKPPPLDMSAVQQDWQEVPPPVRSPVTRTFTRDVSSRPSVTQSSSHSSSSDSDDLDENYVAMTTSSLSVSVGEQSLRLMMHRASEGGVSSPSLRRARGDKQVEYLDLDLHTGRSTSTRQKRCTVDADKHVDAHVERARVDYVVVDPKRTKALRNTREAWHDGRMSTEKDKC